MKEKSEIEPEAVEGARRTRRGRAKSAGRSVPVPDKELFVVTLGCVAPQAGAVFLAASFAEWDASALPMKRGEDGTWRIELSLPAGRYEYKFVIDGVWVCNPGCNDSAVGCVNCVSNGYGTMNRLLDVPGPAQRASTWSTRTIEQES